VISAANNLLFVATDLNVWYSSNEGTSWDILGNDLPFNIIRDLKIHGPTNTLYAGTFGRSMHNYDIGNIVLNTADNLFNSEEIKIYPNPARNEFTIDYKLASEGVITLYDFSGKQIKMLFEGDFGTNSKINISTEGIAAGLYFVKIQSGSQQLSRKLIIQ
jgi:hypothetical protein